MVKRTLGQLLLPIAAIAFQTTPLLGLEYASEPFAGTAGATLENTSGGTGWLASGTGSTWTGGSAFTFDTGLTFVASGTGSAGLVASSAQSIKAGTSGTNDPARTLASAYTIGDGPGEHPVLYYTYLYANTTAATGHEFRIALYNGSSLVTSFGKEVNVGWRLRVSGTAGNNGTAGVDFSQLTTTYVATYLAVVKLAYDPVNAQTVVTSYLAEDSDPALDLTNLSTYSRTASLVKPGKVTFDNVRIFTNNSTTARFDQFRIGDDLANLSNTPDPLLVADSTLTVTADNAPASYFFEVSNAGATQNLSITGITVSGPDGARFAVDTPLPLVIPPGEADFVDFTFTPNTTFQGGYTATLQLVSNAAASPEAVTVNVTNHPDPWIKAADADFSSSGTATTYAVPIENLGQSKPLNISAVTVGGPDAGTVTGLTFPSSVPALSTGQIEFTFTPDIGSLPYQFELVVQSDDPSNPTHTITVDILVEDPVISVSTGILDFGSLSHNPGNSTLNLTVTNTGGTQSLNISDTLLTGSAAYSVLSAPTSLPPGASGDIVVQLSPGNAGGRLSGELEIVSDDSNGTKPKIRLEAFIQPAGTVVARFDFDPLQVSGSTLDLDGSTATGWTTSNLTDAATGIGALTSSNQAASNRTTLTGLTGNRISLGANRESDAQTPVAAGGNNESTWTTFTVTPAPGGTLNFAGGQAVVDTYAGTDQGTNTAADWTLYYSVNGGTTWISLGTFAGQSTTSGYKGPLGLSWDLAAIGSQAGPVAFILDPVSTGGANGTVAQRSVGFDNLIVSAGTVTAGGGGFSTWATGFGIPAEDDYDGTDHDGISALVEYALGLDPTVSESLADSFDGSSLVFTKGSAAAANGDVTYLIQTSSDLLVWDPATPVVETPATLSFTLPSGAGAVFARLKVSRSTP